MSVPLNKESTVELDLFEAFARFLSKIENFETDKNKYEEVLIRQHYQASKRNTFFCYVGQNLLGGLSARSVANIFSGTPIENDRFHFFCTKFENCFKELSPDKQNEYRAIETAFLHWKSGLHKKYNIKNEGDSLHNDIRTSNEETIEKNVSESLKEKELSNEFDNEIAGHYKVVYKLKPDDRSFHDVDKLQIVLLKNGEIRAIYIKKENRGKLKIWIGEGYPNFNSLNLSILLKEKIDQNRQLDNSQYVQNDPFFLMISIPPKTTKKIEVLCAIFAGPLGYDYGPVGRLILLVKENFLNGSTAHELNGIELFFNRFKERSWLRPPATDRVITLARHVELVTRMFDNNL